MSAPAPPNFSTQIISGWMNDINASFVLQSGYLVFMSEHTPLRKQHSVWPTPLLVMHVYAQKCAFHCTDSFLSPCSATRLRAGRYSGFLPNPFREP